MKDKCFSFGERIFTAVSENTLSDILISAVSDENGIKLYKVDLKINNSDDISDAALFWDEKPQGIVGCYTPIGGRGRHIPQGWYPQRQYSTLTDGAPVLSLFNDASENYRTFALSESERPFEISLWLRNDPGSDTLRVRIELFKNEAPGVPEFSFFLRIDERKLPLARCVGDTAAWWQSFYPFESRAYTDDFAGDMPLFSSWYACFQNPTQAVLEKELPVISRLGFKSMIIDDGWSYDGEGDGAYTNCGTWQISREKFPDMHAFVDKAHSLGIKLALWFPVPFVGKNNPDYGRFAGKMLTETMGAGVLDPRYPEVREYITGNFINVIKEYGLDGLKLDFLTNFNCPAPENADGIDCKTVNEGVSKLLAAIENEVRSLNPDMLIEYRLAYIGPSVVRHCNMLRMCDCAFDFITNRIGTVDLRMLGYPVSVHSDMLLWNRDETPENIAVMLLNILFSVPQISVLTAQMNEKQLAVLKNYLAYWTSNRQILLHGSLTVSEPQANYSCVSASNGSLKIAALYLPRVFGFDGIDTDVFNACAEDSLYVESAGEYTAVCYDIYGNKTAKTLFGKGINKLPVPRGGRAELRQKNAFG